jgi:hypothetical protein
MQKKSDVNEQAAAGQESEDEKGDSDVPEGERWVAAGHILSPSE